MLPPVPSFGAPKPKIGAMAPPVPSFDAPAKPAVPSFTAPDAEPKRDPRAPQGPPSAAVSAVPAFEKEEKAVEKEGASKVEGPKPVYVEKPLPASYEAPTTSSRIEPPHNPTRVDATSSDPAPPALASHFKPHLASA
jgi:hypothetical protein